MLRSLPESSSESSSVSWPESPVLRSAIYKGSVWHHRHLPTEHKFRYRVFMMYLDLSELEKVFSLSPLWGLNRFKPARFKRADYFSIDGDTTQSLDAAVRQEVGNKIGLELNGPVCVLTNLRYFGYTTNPISCYYCFDTDASSLLALLIEVTNTPWGERHHYVLDLRHYADGGAVEFDKQLHVSPFMPMDRIYRWRGSAPSESLRYSLASVVKCDKEVDESDVDKSRAGTVQFDSGVVLRRVAVTSGSLNRTLLLQPLMTLKVIAAIYWQALLLWLKKIPFVSHPAKSPAKSVV